MSAAVRLGILVAIAALAVALTGLSMATAGPSTSTPTPTPHPTACVTDPASPIPTDYCSPLPTPTPTHAPTVSPPCVTDPASPVPTDACSPIPSRGPTPTPFPAATVCPHVSPTNCDVPQPRAGDANCDYSLRVDDVLDIMTEAALIDVVDCYTQGNAKCDDGLDALDALYILAYISGSKLYPLPACASHSTGGTARSPET
jgi:hypothetical protein